MKRVMVFGSFDGVHKGHREFLKEAHSFGDYLIAVVAQDHIIEHLKGHLPKINVEERFRALQQEDHVDQVVVGDSKLSVWEVVKEYRPEVIAVGYDQEALLLDLQTRYPEFEWKPEVKIMSSFEPDEYHSSKLT